MYMRMKFYVDGSKRKGEVHLDLKKVTKHLAINRDILSEKLTVTEANPGLHGCHPYTFDSIQNNLTIFLSALPVNIRYTKIGII